MTPTEREEELAKLRRQIARIEGPHKGQKPKRVRPEPWPTTSPYYNDPPPAGAGGDPPVEPRDP